MSDKNLHDDMLKLVRYKILFLKRDYEHAFPEQEELVADNIDAASYTAWKIAVFIQQLHHRTTSVPKKWKRYPPNDPKYREGETLVGFPEEDKKYLRVDYEVLERRPREAFRFEERQIEVLKQIRDNLPGRRPPSQPSIREQLLHEFNQGGVQSLKDLANKIGASEADVQVHLDALERDRQVRRWDGQYGTPEQVEALTRGREREEALRNQVLHELQASGLQSVEELAQQAGATVADVQASLDALEQAGQVGHWEGQYGTHQQVDQLNTVRDKILQTLETKGDFQTREQLVAGFSAAELAQVDTVLSTLVSSGRIQQQGDRYGLPA